jgi:hypothetical protein
LILQEQLITKHEASFGCSKLTKLNMSEAGAKNSVGGLYELFECAMDVRSEQVHTPKSQCSIAMRICSFMPGGRPPAATVRSLVASFTPFSIQCSLSKGVQEADSDMPPWSACKRLPFLYIVKLCGSQSRQCSQRDKYEHCCRIHRTGRQCRHSKDREGFMSAICPQI